MQRKRTKYTTKNEYVRFYFGKTFHQPLQPQPALFIYIKLTIREENTLKRLGIVEILLESILFATQYTA